MKNNVWHLQISTLFFFVCVTAVVVPAGAGEADKTVRATLTPVQYVGVKGDAEKFRALNWSTDGYSGGLKDLDIDYQLDDGLSLTFNGHALAQENDAGAALFLNKQNLGALTIDYDTFRKYYDGTGGYYDRFTTLRVNDLNDDDLHVDVGHFVVSFSPAFADSHDINLTYERHNKSGTKSLLTWGAVKEGSVTRNISPTSQDISEHTDAFSLGGKTEILGFNVKGKQIFEYTDIASVKKETNLSTTSVAADKKKRFQYQNPSAEVMATLLSGEQWFNDDKSYVSLGYGSRKIKSEELENIRETDAGGNPKNFSSAKTRVNAKGENDLSSNTLVSNFVNKLTKELQLTAKFKADYTYREGRSAYPYDASPSNSTVGAAPDGIIEAIDYSQNKNSRTHWGQNIGLRYTGIPRLSLYTDIETGQARNDLREQQENISHVLQWERDTISHMTKSVYTLGGRYTPCKKFNMTTQLRHRVENNDYDNKVDTVGAINSAFFDTMNITGDEISARLTFIPIDQVQTGIRYQLVDTKYLTKVQDLFDHQKSRTLAHIFTYDVIFQPTEQLFLNWSLSRQIAKTATPAASQSSARVPGFNSGFTSILTSASYAINDIISLTEAFTYSWSDNFDNFSSIGLPLGVSEHTYNIELGMPIRPKNSDVSLEPHYGYYNHNSKSMSGFDNYSAHVVWLDCNVKW